MKMMKYLLVLFSLTCCTQQNAIHGDPSSPKNYKPGEILVQFNNGTQIKSIEAVQRKLHLQTIRLVSPPNLYLMKILDGASVEKVMERMRAFEAVKYAEPNYVRTTPSP
jgi:hypothetical protein